ncbi:MAG: hypothetical protein Ct9H90mP9_3950 [Pseudomonadota bacterium]|nr:MAG: hypothetical protein Ct9H90mP9_3950 [Pseudomonadota bacterium]
MAQMFQMMNEAKGFVGLQGLAGAGAAAKRVSYANERLPGPLHNPGEKAKIVEHPDVRRMLMQMRSVTEGLRAMMYTVAWYTDMAHMDLKKPGNITRISSTSIPSARVLERIRDLRLPDRDPGPFGGVGFTRDFPFWEKNARDRKWFHL